MIAFGLNAQVGSALWVRLMLNGALLTERLPGQMSSHSLAIQHEVVPGLNELVAVATVPDLSPDAAPRSMPQLSRADCFIDLELDRELVRDLGDRYEVTTEPVEDQSWRPEETGGEVVLPHRMLLRFQASENLAAPVWTAATPVSADAVQAAVATELQALHDHLAAGELTLFEGRVRRRNEDMARAFPFSGSATDRAERDAAQLEEVLGQPNARVALADGRLPIVATHAQGRLVTATARDGRPPLRILLGDQPPLYLSMTFSMLDGRLAVVR